MKPNGLPSTERLRSLTAIRRLFTDGDAGFVYPFRYIAFAEQGTPSVEVLCSVPKRYHKRANKRNVLRRRTKEAYRLHKQSLQERMAERGIALDVALIYSSKEVLPYKTIENAVERVLAELLSRY